MEITDKTPNTQIKQQKDSVDKKSKNSKLPVIATTIAGTLISMAIIRQYQGKTLKADAFVGKNYADKTKTFLKSFNIEYGLKEMIITSFGSIVGGLTGGLAFGKHSDNEKKKKIKEAVFQFNNVLIPTSIVAFLLKASEKSKSFKGIWSKVASIGLGIGLGMPTAAAISNKINNSVVDPHKAANRKLKIKDCFVHVDDIISALVLTKMPFAQKLNVEKFLPVIYGLCGYETGVKK